MLISVIWSLRQGWEKTVTEMWQRRLCNEPYRTRLRRSNWALSDTLVFFLNEYFIELNKANFYFLNKFLNCESRHTERDCVGPTGVIKQKWLIKITSAKRIDTHTTNVEAISAWFVQIVVFRLFEKWSRDLVSRKEFKTFMFWSACIK